MSARKRHPSSPGRVSEAATLIIAHAGELLTLAGDPGHRRGPAMRELGIIRDGAVAVSGERIVAVGSTDDLLVSIAQASDCQILDATGRVVSPGLIDPHTHPIYGGNRAAEFEMRIEGCSYEEIAAAGGRIRSTVRSTRGIDAEELATHAQPRLSRMLAHGTTTVEAKSGYGLETESEIRQLEAIGRLGRSMPIELVPTFLGAHEIPDEYQGRRDAYINLVTHEMLPRVSKAGLAEFSDVFCDRGVYTNEETRRLQTAAASHGLKLKLHADELASTGGAELAAELGAVSADHLIRISDAGIAALRASSTLAVLLPGTSFSLGARHFAPGRRLIEAGVAVALATDCNAGSCNTESLQMAAALAAQHYRFTAAECWSAMTVNAACALAREERLGRLAPGYQADIVIWDMEDLRELTFHFGVNLAAHVVKKGCVVASGGCTLSP